nr:hypothetical protein [Tanacetum cinerariifolium]
MSSVTDDASDKRQKLNATPSTSTTIVADTTQLDIQTTPEHTTQTPIVIANENINQEENVMVNEDEFINIFSTPVHEVGEPTRLRRCCRSLFVDFFFVRTRRQLEIDGEICMFKLTVSQTEPKNIKEAMADSAWIEAMQEEIHQFKRLDPDGFVDPHHSDKVYQLKKALYGLKQALRACGTPMATKPLDVELIGTPIDQIKYRSTDTSFELTAFSDSDHVGCLDRRKSTYSGIQFLGGDKLVSWSSKKQDYTSMSTAEAEYVSLSASSKSKGDIANLMKKRRLGAFKKSMSMSEEPKVLFTMMMNNVMGEMMMNNVMEEDDDDDNGITNIKSVLTRKAFKNFCQKFHIPEDVHPQLPSPNHTIHEMPVGKIEMDLFAFIQIVNPTKVKVGERERVEEEAKILESTIGRVVPLLPVAPAHLKNELEESVKRLIDEGSSADQVDFAADGGDYGASSEAAIYGKSPSVLRELLASSLLNVEFGIAAMPTLPMVTSLVSATPEHESGAPADSITGLNIHTIGASKRFVISSDSSRHSSTHASEAEEMGVKVTSPVRASLFQDSDYEDSEKYCLSERKRLESKCEKQADLLKVRDAEIKSLKAQLLLKETEAMKAVHLCAQVSASKAAENMHASEIDALKQKNVALENEKWSLDVKVHELEAMCFGFHGQISSYEQLKEQNEEFQDAQMNIVNDKVAKLDADLLEMALHLERKNYPHILNTISGRRWLFTHGLKLAVVKCLNSQGYLSALGAAIIRAIDKEMQDGLSAGIHHGKAG